MTCHPRIGGGIDSCPFAMYGGIMISEVVRIAIYDDENIWIDRFKECVEKIPFREI